jgi:hypothetical protein
MGRCTGPCSLFGCGAAVGALACYIKDLEAAVLAYIKVDPDTVEAQKAHQ